MTEQFSLAPRYRLDDDSTWLVGIDPSRQYWISVNGDEQTRVIIPGLIVSSVRELKTTLETLGSLAPGEKMKIERIAGSCVIYYINQNCYAVEGRVNGGLTWHLFDRETIESLLMTSHPDWIPSPRDVELGRELLTRAFSQPSYAYSI